LRHLSRDLHHEGVAIDTHPLGDAANLFELPQQRHQLGTITITMTQH
jgi:hypothetical protein